MAGRRFVERMEPHKFVDTNLLINLDPLKMANGLASRMETIDTRFSRNSHSAEIVQTTSWYVW